LPQIPASDPLCAVGDFTEFRDSAVSIVDQWVTIFKDIDTEVQRLNEVMSLWSSCGLEGDASAQTVADAVCLAVETAKSEICQTFQDM